MNTENPFEVSKLCSGAARAESPFTNPGMFRVEGDVLVCGHPVILPRICARGLTTENLVARNARVEFVFLRPVLVGRICSVTYFVNKSSTRRRLVVFAFTIGLIAGVFLMITMLLLITTLSASQDLLPTVFCIISIGLLIIVGAFVWWRRGLIRLTLVSYDAPGIYRIRGFSQNYLDTISRHVAELPTNISSADLTNQNQ